VDVGVIVGVLVMVEVGRGWKGVGVLNIEVVVFENVEVNIAVSLNFDSGKVGGVSEKV
ncbi:MAG: hypothetical protein JEZ06_20535, partial [Anaerolineaceae bacterium]|nr:hypothetical protein [Anaerolineaceae bacterium]